MEVFHRQQAYHPVGRRREHDIAFTQSFEQPVQFGAALGILAASLFLKNTRATRRRQLLQLVGKILPEHANAGARRGNKGAPCRSEGLKPHLNYAAMARRCPCQRLIPARNGGVCVTQILTQSCRTPKISTWCASPPQMDRLKFSIYIRKLCASKLGDFGATGRNRTRDLRFTKLSWFRPGTPIRIDFSKP